MKFKIQEVTAKERAVHISDPESPVTCDNCGQHVRPPYWRVNVGGLGFTICPTCRKENITI